MNEIRKYDMESLSFMITDKCNLNCEFCSRNAESKNNNFMEPEFIESQIGEAIKWAPLKTINISRWRTIVTP